MSTHPVPSPHPQSCRSPLPASPRLQVWPAPGGHLWDWAGKKSTPLIRVERFLYRLSRSPFAHRFVLKGAMLMNVWAKQPFRRTRDLDLLGYGEPSAAHLSNLGTLLPTLTYAGPVRGDVRGAVAALVAFCLIRRRHGRAREVMTDAVAS